jgi:hypothetical protein
VLTIMGLTATSAGADTAPILSQPLFVNMRDSGPYTLGRYVNGLPSPVGPVATGTCGLWSPSAARAGKLVYLYAAQCSGPYQGTGWHTLVRWTSFDGGRTFSHRTVVKQFTGAQIRMPTVVYDRSRFHLWYSQDRDGRLAQDLMYAASVDGLHFTAPQRKFTAGTLTAIHVATVFRSEGAWWMLIEGYSPDLKQAGPHLLTFGSTWQPQYVYRSPVAITDMPTQKIDASMVCRDEAGWQGLFVVYGDPAGRERTMHFQADALEGPWRLVSDPEVPVLSFLNGGLLMHSVENPTRLEGSAELAAC